MRRTWLVATAVPIAVLAAIGATYVATRPGSTPEAPVPVPAAARPDVLAAVGGGAAPTPAGVRAALRTALADPAFGGSLAGVVVDATTGRELFSRAADAPVPPASTLKLATAVAALHVLGPDGRLTTDVVRRGDRLFLVGGGDVTLATRRRPGAGYPPAATLDALARRTAAALAGPDAVDRAPVRLRYDATEWSGPTLAPGWNSGYLTAGDVSRLSPLRSTRAGCSPASGRGPRRRRRRPPPPSRPRSAGPVWRVAGRPRPATAPALGPGRRAGLLGAGPALVQRMLTVSDNDLAEALGRAVAPRGRAAGLLRRRGGGRHHDAGPAGDRRCSGARSHDASGLSRLDRVTARGSRRRCCASRPAMRSGSARSVRGCRSPASPARSPTATGTARAAAAAGLVAGQDRHPRRGQHAGRAGRGRRRPAAGLLVPQRSRRRPPLAAEAALDRLAARLAGCGCR